MKPRDEFHETKYTEIASSLIDPVTLRVIPTKLRNVFLSFSCEKYLHNVSIHIYIVNICIHMYIDHCGTGEGGGGYGAKYVDEGDGGGELCEPGVGGGGNGSRS